MRSVILLAGLAACSPARGGYFGTTEPRHGPDELWVNNSGEPEYIDPGLNSDSTGGTIIKNIFEGLTRPHPQTLQPLPGVAERWERSEDGLTWTFHLRADARWSDGRPVTASDFVYAWTRVLDPATAAKYASQLYLIAGGEAFNKGSGSRESLGLRAVDDRTLEVRLRDPIPYFLEIVTTLQTFRPVPRWAIERALAAGDESGWTDPGRIVSNGAYRLVEWEFRHRAVFEKSPYFWDRDNVRIERVVAYMVESYPTVLNMYRAGEIDFIGENTSLPIEMLDLLRTMRDYERAPQNAVYFYWFNITRPPVNDVRVRRALNLAVDKERLVRYVTRGGQIPALGIVPPGLGGYEPPPGERFDPARARALLAEAGYPEGQGFPTLALTYNTAEGHRHIAEAIQQMWKENLGIDVVLRNQEWNVFLRSLQVHDFQVARLGWVGDYPDPYTFLELCGPDSGNNHSGWRDREYQRLLDLANQQRDRRERLRVFRQAEARLLEAMPLVPLYVYTRAHLVKPYVRGLYLNMQRTHPWRDLWIDLDWRNHPERLQEGRR